MLPGVYILLLPCPVMSRCLPAATFGVKWLYPVHFFPVINYSLYIPGMPVGRS